MKLRISGNSIRLRLSQSEVARLHKHGVVENAISFGRSALTYRLIASEVAQPEASFTQNVITVVVPQQTAMHWATSDEVSISAEQPLPAGDKLSILIEKDFQCLTPRNEDELDNFPNPNKTC